MCDIHTQPSGKRNYILKQQRSQTFNSEIPKLTTFVEGCSHLKACKVRQISLYF